jgi:hypothetical protein
MTISNQYMCLIMDVTKAYAHLQKCGSSSGEEKGAKRKGKLESGAAACHDEVEVWRESPSAVPNRQSTSVNNGALRLLIRACFDIFYDSIYPRRALEDSCRP